MPDVVRTVGRYEILRELGRGPHARVHLARQLDLDRLVALEERAGPVGGELALRRLVRDLRAGGSLRHPNIVPVQDAFAFDGSAYVAMELMERGSLYAYAGRLSLAEAGGVLEGVLAALAHAEQHGVAHGALQPGNVLVTADGRVKVAGFGTAGGAGRYTAPERAAGAEPGPAADLYAVGRMAEELVAGDPGGAFRAWTARLAAADAVARPPSANEAWDELDELLVAALGPRWRRHARLGDPPEPGRAPRAGGDAVSPPAAVPDEPASAQPPDRFVPEVVPFVSAPPWPGTVQGRVDQPVRDIGGEAPAGPATPPAAASGERGRDEAAALMTGAGDGDAGVDGTVTPAHEPGDEPGTAEAGREETPGGDDEPATRWAAPDEAWMAGGFAAPGMAAPTAPGEAGPSVPVEAGPSVSVKAGPSVPGEAGASVPVEAGASVPVEAGLSVPGEAGPSVPGEAGASVPGEAGPSVPAARRRPRTAFLALALVVAATAAGAIVGGRGDGGVRTVAASAGDVAFRVPSDLRRLPSPPAVPGLTLRDAVAYAAPNPAGGAAVVVGLARSSDPTLLPRGFRRALGLRDGDVPARTAVRLDRGGMEAFRYADLRPDGLDSAVTAYVAPTSAGVATVACVAPVARAACDAVARSLAVREATPHAVGPDPTYAQRLSSVLGDLRTAVARGHAALRRADATADLQAAAAEGVARAYRRAAGSLRGAAESPADRGLGRGLRARLRGAATAWDEAATAAAAVDAVAFEGAESRIRTAERAMRRAVDRFGAAGYTIRGAA